MEPYSVALLRLLHTDVDMTSRCFVVGSTPDRHKEAWQRAREALQRRKQTLTEKRELALDAPLAVTEVATT